MEPPLTSSPMLPRGKSDHLHQPANGTTLDIDRCVIAPGAARVEGGSEELRQDAHGGGRGVDPAEEAQVPVAHGIGEYVFGHGLQEEFGVLTRFGQGLFQEHAARLRRHGAEDGSIPHAGEVLDGEVDRAVAEAA
jgi:hypothetical protein